jgi:hypothetical protein
MLAQYEALAGFRRLADVTPFAVRMRLVIPFSIYCNSVYFALNSYSLRKRWRSMLVSGVSIVEGFLNLFFDCELFFVDLHVILAGWLCVFFGVRW